MKKLLSILSIVIAFSLNAQITGVTLPNTKSGKIQIDTTGKNIASWILYKVNGNEIVKTISYSNELIFDSLEVGNYWLLGQSKNPNSSTNYSYEAKYTIGIVPTNPCPTSNNIFIGMVHDVNMNADFFCGQNSQGYQMQWYLDSIQVSGMPIQFCNSALPMMSNGVLTIVGYGNTCNEYFTLGLGNNANYPPGTFAGGGSNNGANSTTASLKENTMKKFDIYPNPTNDVINIHRINQTDEMITIEIKDLNGKIIYKNQGLNDSISLKPIAETGIYFLTIKDQNQEILYKSKVILN